MRGAEKSRIGLGEDYRAAEHLDFMNLREYGALSKFSLPSCLRMKVLKIPICERLNNHRGVTSWGHLKLKSARRICRRGNAFTIGSSAWSAATWFDGKNCTHTACSGRLAYLATAQVRRSLAVVLAPFNSILDALNRMTGTLK